MTEAQAQVGSVAGPLAWLAAVLTSLSVAAVLFFGLVYGAEMSWPWGVALPVLGIALTFLSVACTITAAVDCWLALGRPRRRRRTTTCAAPGSCSSSLPSPAACRSRPGCSRRSS